jgi:CRP-like cAMP-binding protein
MFTQPVRGMTLAACKPFAPPQTSNNLKGTMFEQVARYLSQYLTLGDDEVQSFVSLLKPLRLGRKESVIAPGTVPSFDMFVETGCLRIYSITRDGSDRNLHFGTEDSWWCQSAIAGLSPLFAGIDTLETTELLMMDVDRKERLCADVPRFERLFRLLTQRTVSALQQRLMVSLQNTAEARYREFSRLYPDLQGRIPCYHVASYLGISPEFLSKLRRKDRRLS